MFPPEMAAFHKSELRRSAIDRMLETDEKKYIGNMKV